VASSWGQLFGRELAARIAADGRSGSGVGFGDDMCVPMRDLNVPSGQVYRFVLVDFATRPAFWAEGSCVGTDG